MDIREFKNTYKEFSPSLIWDWCAKPTPEEIDFKLSSFSYMGIKSVYIRPSKGLATPYLSEDYFELIRTAARRSARYGIDIWVFDENASASGIGGGEITSVDDYRLRDFIKVNKTDIEKTDDILAEDNSSALVLRDISALRASTRNPIANITDSFVSKCFSEEVYDRYIRGCKRFIGYEIKGIVSGINLPDDSTIYSPEVFRRLDNPDKAKYGKKLLSKDKETLSSYYGTVSDCIRENFVSLLRKKCGDNNLSLSVSVCGKSVLSRQKQYMEADSIVLYADAKNHDIMEFKLAESISSQFNKPFTVYLSTGKFASAAMRFNKAAKLCAMGAQAVSYNSVAFSLTDRRKYEDNSLVLSSSSEKDISGRMSRFSKVTSETKSAADVLIVYSPESYDFFSELCEHFTSQNIQFHITEKDIFTSFSKCADGKITVGENVYNTVVYEKNTVALPDAFSGKSIALDTTLSPKNCNITVDSTSTLISGDKDFTVNRRKDGANEYIYITTTKGDTEITVSNLTKKLFAADSSNGEIYEIPETDSVCKFILKNNKTVLLIVSDEFNYDIIPPYTDEIKLTYGEKVCDVPFALSSAGENILPLKTVNACFGRKAYRENNIDNLHKEFYALPDGETVKVKYPFTAHKDKIGTVKAYFEYADNFDFVELNGIRLENLTQAENDPRFFGTDITEYIADGKNTLAVEYKKCNNYTPDFKSFTPLHLYSFNTTSFEPVYLSGDFDVDGETITQLDEYTNDVTECGMPYYYGAITYVAKLPEDGLSGTLLTVHGNFDICRIKIGKRELTFYSEVPETELFNLDSGTVAEITVFNTPYNLLRTTEEKAKPFGIEKIEIISQ